MARQSVKERAPRGRVGVQHGAGRVGACNHHWIIDPPNGPTSSGNCKMCGRKRKFPNSSEDSIWDGGEGRSRWNDMRIARRRRPGDEPVAEENIVVF